MKILFFAVIFVLTQFSVSIANASHIAEGEDFATSVLGNPWDMADQSDVYPLLWTHNLASATVAEGIMTGVARDSDPHFWLLFPKIPSAILPMDTRQIPIDSDRYDRLTFRMWLPEDTVPGSRQGRLVWHHGGETEAAFDAAYSESTLFPVYPGWRLYQFDLSSLPILSGRPWGGMVDGLRVDPCLGCQTTFRVDWARLHASGDTGGKFSDMPSGMNRLLVASNENPSLDHLGVFSPAAPASSSIDVGGLPPGTYRIAPLSDGDYALAERGDAWDMNSPSDFVWVANSGFTNATVSGNRFTGTTHHADPYLLMDVPALKPINADKYRYLAVDMTLNSLPAQESGLLVYWGKQSASFSHHTAFIPVSPGRHTYRIDLGTYPDWHGLIRALRIDPLNGPNAGAGIGVTLHGVRLTDTANYQENPSFLDTPLVINGKPGIEFVTPRAETGEDYAEARLGKPWDMAGTGVRQPELGNLQAWRYIDGAPEHGITGPLFHGTSRPAPATQSEGDPYVFLVFQQNDAPIDADTYRLFGFDLYVDFDPQQQAELTEGAVLRVAWKSGDTDPGLTSDDILLMPGLHTYWLDMKHLVYEPFSRRVWAGNVRYLRIDPFEFSNSRHFYLGRTRLTALPSGRWVLPVSVDLTDEADSRLNVTVQASGQTLASHTDVTPGRLQFLVNLANLPLGEHTLTIAVSDGLNTLQRPFPVPVRKLAFHAPLSPFERANADRVFNWAEALFPVILPRGSASTTQHACVVPGAYARYYAATQACLMTTDGVLVYTMGAGELTYAGPMRDFIDAAIAAGY